jgi:hypothetical protein
LTIVVGKVKSGKGKKPMLKSKTRVVQKLRQFKSAGRWGRHCDVPAGATAAV